MLTPDEMGLEWDKPPTPQYRCVLSRKEIYRHLWETGPQSIAHYSHWLGRPPGDLLIAVGREWAEILRQFQHKKGPMQ